MTYLLTELWCKACDTDAQAEGTVSLDMFYWECGNCGADNKTNWEGM